MVLIPAGSFKMGNSKDKRDEFMNSAWSVHKVELDVNETTVGQFKQFVSQSGYDHYDHIQLGRGR